MNLPTVQFLLFFLFWIVEGNNIPGSIIEEDETEVKNNEDYYPTVSSDYDEKVPIINFCCDRHHYVNVMNRSCLDSGQYLEPLFHSMDGNSLEPDSVDFRNNTQFNRCASFLVPQSDFHLLKNGQILMKSNPGYIVLERKFCLLWMGQNDTYEMSALICFPEEKESASLLRTVLHTYLYPIGMSISALFLAATFVVYCLVEELQDLLGKSFMCSVASLCVTKVFGVLAKVLGSAMPAQGCAFVGIMMHLGFLHAFFWLNVISFVVCFSVWRQGKINNGSRRPWFAVGCIYAFGVPLIILALILIHAYSMQLDHLPVPKPGFIEGSCGFSNRGAQVVYFYAPITIILIVNLILFCLSAFRLCFLAKQSTACTFHFKHYLKLLVLMGIPWIFEVLSFFFGSMEQFSVSTFIWVIFDVFNSLQGVIIFIVFACRRTVLARAAETVCGGNYAKKKYPDIFLKQACEETVDGRSVDLRLADTEKKSHSNTNEDQN